MELNFVWKWRVKEKGKGNRISEMTIFNRLLCPAKNHQKFIFFSTNQNHGKSFHKIV
jgi:hypothetical protein